jgi:phosphoribosylaminoimidazole-succinocarboxamide synthase
MSPLTAPLLETRLHGRAPHRQGKVRDIFDLGSELLLIATDRISAFDFVLGSGIPDKGRVLTQLSAFWFARTTHIVPNHVLSLDVPEFPGRAMRVRKTNPVPIECVARGYLSGSGWKEYAASGTVCGIALPAGLRESDRLPTPLFTPATKAASGHDINIPEDEAARLIGRELTSQLRELTLALYAHGVEHAATRGIVLADTKFEFGLTDAGEVILIDEVMTPDSSRYWPAEQYAPGGPQPSFDKQYVRD